MKKLTKMYYHEKYDVMVIVENGKIYKYIGEHCSPLMKIVFPLNEWYEAKMLPKVKDGFILIGTWK